MRREDARSTPSLHPDKAWEPCPDLGFTHKRKDSCCFGVICYQAMDDENFYQINLITGSAPRGPHPDQF